MVAKPEGLKQLSDTFWYFTKDGKAWRNIPCKGGWVEMKIRPSGYYRVGGNLYTPERAIWMTYRGEVLPGYQVHLKQGATYLHLDNLELVSYKKPPAMGKKANEQREALIRSHLRRIIEVENLLLSTFARHFEHRHKEAYQGCMFLQQEYNEIIAELYELGVDYLKERERREPPHLT